MINCTMLNTVGGAAGAGYTIMNLAIGNGTDAVIKLICSNLTNAGGKL